MAEAIQVNGLTVHVEPKTERPRAFLLCESAASTTTPSGEKIEIVRSITNPFHFEIRGERATINLNLEPIFQEAMLHVVRENFPEKS